MNKKISPAKQPYFIESNMVNFILVLDQPFYKVNFPIMKKYLSVFAAIVLFLLSCKSDKKRAAKQYGIMGIPFNFLIDRSGIIVAKNLRGDDLDKKLAEVIK
jgi:peroxiredoxin